FPRGVEATYMAPQSNVNGGWLDLGRDIGILYSYRLHAKILGQYGRDFYGRRDADYVFGTLGFCACTAALWDLIGSYWASAATGYFWCAGSSNHCSDNEGVEHREFEFGNFRTVGGLSVDP